MELQVYLGKRENDPTGEGHFGASRGSRKHTGQDYACLPGAVVCAPVAGQITKLGYTYGSGYGDADLNSGEGEPYRYVQITDFDGLHHRLFYVKPIVAVGMSVQPGDLVGEVQDITLRYSGMVPHVHYEIMVRRGEYLDPTKPRV